MIFNENHCISIFGQLTLSFLNMSHFLRHWNSPPQHKNFWVHTKSMECQLCEVDLGSVNRECDYTYTYIQVLSVKFLERNALEFSLVI